MLIQEMFLEARDEDHPEYDSTMPHDPFDKMHMKTLQKTGFYGTQGAGCLFFAQNTKRFLIGLRSDEVEQPETWGTFGGAIDPGNDPLETIRQETKEEVGYTGKVSEILPMFVFRKNSFRYSNFLVVVPNEFRPRLNWEHDDARWFEFGKWPSPLHFGLVSLFNDPESSALMQKLAQE